MVRSARAPYQMMSVAHHRLSSISAPLREFSLGLAADQAESEGGRGLDALKMLGRELTWHSQSTIGSSSSAGGGLALGTVLHIRQADKHGVLCGAMARAGARWCTRRACWRATDSLLLRRVAQPWYALRPARTPCPCAVPARQNNGSRRPLLVACSSSSCGILPAAVRRLGGHCRASTFEATCSGQLLDNPGASTDSAGER